MEDKIKEKYHSGKRLRKLRELQGIDERDFSTTFNIDVDTLNVWETDSVPHENIIDIIKYFEITKYFFEVKIDSESELRSLAQSQLFPKPNETEMLVRIERNKKNQSEILDLSELNITDLPVGISELTWLKKLIIDNNNIEFIPSYILLLHQLSILECKQNLIDGIPLFIKDNSHLTVIGDEVDLQKKNKDICVFVLDEGSLNNYNIVDRLRKSVEINYLVTISAISNLVDLLELHTNISHFIYVGDIKVLTESQKMEEIKDVPWLLFTDNDFENNTIKTMCKTFSPNTFIQPVTTDNIDTVLKAISYQNNIPKVKLTSIELFNIGVYEHVKVNFNANLTALIGVNGAGKSTVLKAISLGMLGPRKSGLNKNDAADLLRINGVKKGVAVYVQEGEVILSANIDGVECQNSVKIKYNEELDVIDFIGEHFKELFHNEQLTNLVLGISEKRNSNVETMRPLNQDTFPKVTDLLPLINGNELPCLKSFETWLGNLALDLLKGNVENKEIIDICFKLFSAFMEDDISFKELTVVDPLEIWIEHQNPKQVIPLRLTSQGYKSVMGWVGYIIQRMFEAHKDTLQPFNQANIIIIDEIDQLLSVKWQQKILHVLSREFFPQTQWIITSHSPMVLNNLDQNQVVQLRQKDEKLIAQSNDVDLWMWQYGDIIRNFFEIKTKEPKVQIDELTKSINDLEKTKCLNKNNDDLDKLLIQLDRAKKSRSAVDELYKEQQKLHDREKELSDLIDKLVTKIGTL